MDFGGTTMTDAAEKPRLITIEQFIIGMMGFRSRISYYNHQGEPGWPQRVYIGKKPMLRYDDCMAYYNGLVSDPVPEAKTPPVRRRRVGRPVRPPPAKPSA
jgi:hypothetical protein